MWPVYRNCLVKHTHASWYCGSGMLYRCVTCNFVISRLEKIHVAYNGWVILAVRGGARGIWNNTRTGKTYVMPPLVFCFPALCSLYLIIFCWFVGFYFFSIKSPMNVCNLLPTATYGQELGCLNYIGVCIKDHLCLFILNSLSAGFVWYTLVLSMGEAASRRFYSLSH